MRVWPIRLTLVVLNPWVFQNLIDIDSLFIIFLEHFDNQIFAFCAHFMMLFESWRILHNLFHYLFQIFVLKWIPTSHKVEECYTKGPDVTLRAWLPYVVLWCHENGGTCRVLLNTFLRFDRNSKIDEFNITAFSGHNILWFDIPVDDVLLMTMLQSE